MTPPVASPVVSSAAKRILNSPANLPWPQLWASLENFCAFMLYKLVLGNGTMVDNQTCMILQEQLMVRGLGEAFDVARDVILVLRADPSLTLTLPQVVELAKRLQTWSVETLKTECKSLIPQAPEQAPVKLACPVAWLLTDKGCNKSRESEQVMQAARRLCLAEEPIPFEQLLHVLQDAYERAQNQLMFASSRTKVPVEPMLEELLHRNNLTPWGNDLKDLMTVLGTAAHVNRRRSLRALQKVQHLKVDEVLHQIQVAAQQSDLIEMLDDSGAAWDDFDGDSS